jgi:hypothetical protein
MLAFSTYQRVTSFPRKSPTLERKLLAQPFGYARSKCKHLKRFSLVENSASPASANPGTSYDEHRPKTPPPDLPSLLLDSRIVYIGMPLVPAVTELIVSELLYMQYTDPGKACYLYINSTGCTRADGEVVGFETEATAIYDTMKYIGNEVI